MSTQSRSAYSTGEITNFMSVDSQRVSDFLAWANMLWSAPLQIGIAFYLLWQQVQAASVSGLLFMLVLVPVNGWISRRIHGEQALVMRKKDHRTKLMNEILNGMKVLKLYAWENSFEQKIFDHREVECRQLKKIAYLTGFMFFAFSAAPFLVGCFSMLADFIPVGSRSVCSPSAPMSSPATYSIPTRHLCRCRCSESFVRYLIGHSRLVLMIRSLCRSSIGLSADAVVDGRHRKTPPMQIRYPPNLRFVSPSVWCRFVA